MLSGWGARLDDQKQCLFLLPDPKREKCHVLAVPAEHRRANCLSHIRSPEENVLPCVSIHRECVAFRSALFFPFQPHSLILPPSWLTLGAAGSYLEVTLMCVVIPAPAGGWNKTHIDTKPVYTERGLHKSQAFAWHLYILSSFPSSSVFWTLSSYLIPVNPTHSAPHTLSSVLRWCGRILFMGRVIWSSCHMAEVIRWSSCEEVMNTVQEKGTQTFLSCCLPRLCALTHSKTLIGVRSDAPKLKKQSKWNLNIFKEFYILDFLEPDTTCCTTEYSFFL